MIGRLYIFAVVVMVGTTIFSTNPQAAETDDAVERIHTAVANDNEAEVRKLLTEHPGLLNARNARNPRTPLHTAVMCSWPKMVKLLLSFRADVHARCTDSWEEDVSALHLATSRYNAVEMIRLLLAQKARINARAKDGSTPLHSAMKAELGSLFNAQEKKDVVEFLLANGADVNAKGPQEGATPLYLAVRRGEKDIAAVLLAHRRPLA